MSKVAGMFLLGGLSTIAAPVIGVPLLAGAAILGLQALSAKKNEEFDAQVANLEQQAYLQQYEAWLATQNEVAESEFNTAAHFQKQLITATGVEEQVRAVAGSAFPQYFKAQMELPDTETPTPPPGWGRMPAPAQPQFMPAPQQFTSNFGMMPSGFAPQSQNRITREETLTNQYSNDNELFRKFLLQPHGWIIGKTGGGKTFLLLRFLKEWLQENPDGEVYILDRNFGKPDRVTGEIFDWNGFPQEQIYSEDEDIINVLQVLRDRMMDLAAAFSDFARGKTTVRPQKAKVMIVVTEWNALTDANKTTQQASSALNVEAILPILQQGNGYGYKVVFDSQTTLEKQTGISPSTRQQLSLCLVGENTVNVSEYQVFGCDKATKQSIYQEASALRAAGKRACVIQLGEGAPQVGLIPEMGWLRDFRFTAPQHQQQVQVQSTVQHDEPDDVWDEPSPQVAAPRVAPIQKPLTLDEVITGIKQWMGDGIPTDAQLTAKASELLGGHEVSPQVLQGLKITLGLAK